MFVVCGEALWDLLAVEGERGLSFDARIGGSPLNVAVGLARLGQQAALVTGLSSDRLGDRLAAALAREGVVTSMLLRTDRPSTVSLVDLGPDGTPSYAFYGCGAADRAIGADDLPTLGPEVWGVHAGSYSLVVEPVGTSLAGLFERERGQRLLTLDPNVRLAVEPDAELWRGRIGRLVCLADLVKASDEDLRLLYPGACAAEIAGRWLAAGTGLVVVTHGAGGAEAFSPAGRIAVPAHRAEVVDTVGAGDAFQAALIAGLAERGVRDRLALDRLGTHDIEALAGFAASAAAITCSRRGADLPRRAELALFAGAAF